MTQNFKEKLTKILKEVERWDTQAMPIEEAVKAIILVNEEIIPTAKKVSDNHYDPCPTCGNLHQEPCRCEGFNKCRQEILDRLKG